MEPQGAAGNAGPGRSNKLGLCESDRGNKFKRQGPGGNTLRSHWRRQIGSAGLGRLKGERQRNHPGFLSRESSIPKGAKRRMGRSSPLGCRGAFPGMDCAVSTQLRHSWKAPDTSEGFSAPFAHQPAQNRPGPSLLSQWELIKCHKL